MKSLSLHEVRFAAIIMRESGLLPALLVRLRNCSLHKSLPLGLALLLQLAGCGVVRCAQAASHGRELTAMLHSLRTRGQV